MIASMLLMVGCHIYFLSYLLFRYEKIVGSAVEEDASGPLEAMIHNLNHEIDQKGSESQDLQRRWIVYQTELVALQVGQSVSRAVPQPTRGIPGLKPRCG